MKKNRVFGGILLVAGTAIGAGMIALPITSGLGGFVPSIVLLLACWVYMTTTAFLFLEATVWFERDVNIVSIAEHTLGFFGKAISWLVYLFLLYCLTTAYLSGCGALFLSSMEGLTRTTLPNWVGPIPFLLLFGFCVYLGTKPVDYINRALMLGMVLTFAVLSGISVDHVKTTNLAFQSWPVVWSSLAIMVTSFGYHIIIPSLSYYLGYKVDLLKKALFFGGLIPLIFYLIWEVVTLGVIPATGAHSFATLATSMHAEASLISTLDSNVPGVSIIELLRFFSYFAILTSFLGVSLSLSDFLADGFKIEKNARGRFFITLLTFLPPLFFSLVFPNVFVSALKYAAIFVAILLGILPAVIVWSGRYRLKLESKFKVFGGRPLLVLVILISLAVIVVDLIDQWH
ncbi:MAG: Tyrosine-specific transport protein [Chlamydiae bacterium]|nr:Tyrosine-specific transport protein [Chlamydiota bacterium]